MFVADCTPNFSVEDLPASEMLRPMVYMGGQYTMIGPLRITSGVTIVFCISEGEVVYGDGLSHNGQMKMVPPEP